MEGINNLPLMVKQGYYMLKHDIKEAYLHVLVDPLIIPVRRITGFVGYFGLIGCMSYRLLTFNRGYNIETEFSKVEDTNIIIPKSLKATLKMATNNKNYQNNFAKFIDVNKLSAIKILCLLSK
ncbi:hypothetical protein ACTFIY_004601 [Dictyostelium cf. discoideum]